MERLISITKRIVDEYKERMDTPYNDGALLLSDAEKWAKHALFLSRELNLSMFVPCKFVDGIWVVLEEPKKKLYTSDSGTPDLDYDVIEMEEYQEAKDRVLFANFKYNKMGFAYSTTQSECGFDEEYMESKTIEDLVKYNLELTETAKKQIAC